MNNALQSVPSAMSLLTKLGNRLGEDDKFAVQTIPFEVKSFQSRKRLQSSDEQTTTCQLLVSGFACRYRLLSDGRRQIVAVHIAGDFIDLAGLLFRKSDHHVVTLGPTTVASVPHHKLLRILDTYPHLERILWRETLIEAAICREWVANIGARPAMPRIAHLFCEIITRLQAMGLAVTYSSEFPLSQEVLGEAVGLSTVSVNRTLQELRRLGLIEFTRGRLSISDWSGLVELSEFDASYLHQSDGPI